MPTVLQMEAVECGAAALAMVLAHHGRWVPLEELRIQCGVSRDGSKASNLLRGARRYGLEARGFRYENVEDLFDVSLPVILFWNLQHFVVLEGFGRGFAWINDPAVGPRRVTMEELASSFSGVVLTFQPGPEFEPGGQAPSALGGLRRRLGGERTSLAYVVLCGLLLVVPGLVVPAFSRVFVDEILVAGSRGLLRPLLLAMLATAGVTMAITHLQQKALLRLESALSIQTAARFFRHLLRLPVSFFAQRLSGEIAGRVAINDRVAGVLSGRLAVTAVDGVLVVFYLVLMLLYSVPLTIVVCALALLHLLALRLAGRGRREASQRLLQEAGKLGGTAVHGLRDIETLKATGAEDEFFSRWGGYHAKALRAQQEVGRLVARFVAVPALIFTLVTAAVLVVGSFAVIDGRMTLGGLVAYQALVGFFLRPLGQLVSFGVTLQELRADLGKLDDVLRYPSDEPGSPRGESGARRGSRLTGKVELRGVTFGYSPLDPPLIEGLDLTVSPGQRVALVGRSGSGKSTVAKLITGLYRPWEGEILLDGVPRDELPPALVRSSLASVDQSLFLFEGSVRDNLTMWDETLPMERITRAARDAQVAPVVEARRGAYDSTIEEGGRNLSGGERQRLEIARALCGEPTILVLDEATSALDPGTEQAIDRSLRRRGCTSILVAHRLSTIRDCDEILVLDRGAIVERGSHDRLVAQGGLYASLIQE